MYPRSVDFSDLVFSLSSHRHSLLDHVRRGTQNVSDVLTKSLDRDPFEKHGEYL